MHYTLKKYFMLYNVAQWHISAEMCVFYLNINFGALYFNVVLGTSQYFRPPGPVAAGRVGLYILMLYFFCPNL